MTKTVSGHKMGSSTDNFDFDMLLVKEEEEGRNDEEGLKACNDRRELDWGGLL